MDEEPAIAMRALLEAARNAQVLFTPDLRIVAVNRRYCEISGRDADSLVGRNAFEAFEANPDDPDADVEAALQASVTLVIERGEIDEMPIQQHDLQGPDGRYDVRYWRLVNAPVSADPSAPSVVTHVLCSVEDVTRTVLGNRMDEAKRRAAMRSADVTSFDFDPAAETLMRTPQLDAMFGFGPEETGGAIAPFLDRIHREDLPAVMTEIERVTRTIGADLHHDYRAVWPDGTMRWLIGRGESIRDPDTQGIHIVGVLLDVTRIKENESRLQDALAARDMLVAEVNHRVKNSLQMVSSILNLEARQTTDTAARTALQAATARVQAVAAIHASLYEDGDVGSVQLDTYLGRLRDHLRTSLTSDDRTIRIELDAEPIRLPTDKAVTLSLAVNELVTNSFKHGAWTNGEGTVTVWLRRQDNDMIALEVRDDGTQSPVVPLVARSSSSGLGKRLIAGMAAQLNGTIEEETSDGWRTRITFAE